MLSLEGKEVLITGSCQGLGRAIALQCARAGAAAVVLTGFEAERAKGEVVASEVRRVAPAAAVHFVPADLSDEAACRALVAEASRLLKRPPRCLVNSAAINPRADLTTTTTALYHQIFRVNLLAPFILTQELTRLLRRREDPVRGGSIVNIASVQAHCGAPFSMAYSSLKAALVVQSKNNAKELLAHGIRVNAVLPGWMPTENEHILQGAMDGADWLQRADTNAPLGRILRPEECANAVVFLLSDLSCMTTGTSMEVHPELIVGSLPDGVGDGRKAKL